MTDDALDGPLPIPLQPGGRTEVRIAATERLRGHTTAKNWLPAGLSPDLDALRATHRRLRDRTADDLDALMQLHREYAGEDRAHQEALQEALRTGEADPEDHRTNPEEREAQIAAVQERLDADVIVFAEHADKIIDTIREQEPAILGQLRVRLNGAQEKRREAQRLLADATEEEWRLHREGQWVLTTSDDGGFGRQPAPKPEPMPAMFNRQLLETSLERHWSRQITPRAAA